MRDRSPRAASLSFKADPDFRREVQAVAVAKGENPNRLLKAAAADTVRTFSIAKLTRQNLERAA